MIGDSVERRDFSLRGKRVFVAGHRGMVGGAILRRLASEDCEILVAPRERLDLREPAAVMAWFKEHRPQAVFLAAAKVGGILANDLYPADFLHENLAIETSVIGAACSSSVEKLMFLGSSCIYPKMAIQPIAETSLLTGPLEPTNKWYAIAKIAGIKLCDAYRRQYGRDFVSVMPTNLYGPGDNYDLSSSHVLPALIRKVHEAKIGGADKVEIWGSGTPLREFLHVDDLADACVFLMKVYSEEGPINVGFGDDVTIRELAELVCDVVGYEGKLVFDHSKPDGTPRKLMDSQRLHGLGWRPTIGLREGIEKTYAGIRDRF